MKKSIIIVIILICTWHCSKKHAEGDLSGKEYIRGRLFLYDNLTQQANGISLGKKKILLSYSNSPDTLNFLVSATTDDDGYFIFQNLKKDSLYRLYYEETVNGVLYQGVGNSYAPIDTMRLPVYVSKTKQNGIHIIVTDQQGAVLSNATVCIFNSTLVPGFTSNACEGSTYKLTTNTYGQAFKFDIPEGIYYINSSLDIGGIPWMSKDTLTVGKQIKFDTVKLTLPNGMRFTVMDSLGTRVNGASICIFQSLALYQQDTCDGSNYQLLSSSSGEAAKYNIPPATYYIYSTLKTGSFIWAARDTLELNNQILESTLILRKKH